MKSASGDGRGDATDEPVPYLADSSLYAQGGGPDEWAANRRSASVRWEAPRGVNPGHWVVTSYSAVRELYTDHRLSSSRGMRLGGNDDSVAAASGRMLIVTDPPYHATLRAAVISALGPQTRGSLGRNVRLAASDALESLPDVPVVDLVPALGRMPATVVCRLLDIPDRDISEVARLTSVAFGLPCETLSSGEASAQLMLYIIDMISETRRFRRDNFVARLLDENLLRGIELSDDEIVLNCLGILLGGSETTRHASVGASLALGMSMRDGVDVGRGEIPRFVEEVLRFYCPAIHVARIAVEDIDCPEYSFSEGEVVTLWNAAANRDPQMFDNPDSFQADRSPNVHLSFGGGSHYCLGAVLARLELRTITGALVDRFDSIELEDSLVRSHSAAVWGFDSALVRLSRRHERLASHRLPTGDW